MSKKISDLPAATLVNTTDAFEKSDAGTAPSQKVTYAQISAKIETTLAKVQLSGGKSQFNADGSGSMANGALIITSAGNVNVNALNQLNADGSVSLGSNTLVLNADGTTPLTVSTPSAGTSYTIDLTKPSQTISTVNQIDFTATSNRSANGNRTAYIRVAANGGGARALSFNASWVFLNGAPTTIAANKVGILSLTSFGNAETDIVAAWGVQL